jgi:RNA polymerase sigma-70 factor (ECF subfamily)
VGELDYEQIVALHHEHLYRFAFSLAGNPDDAAELTQETYVRLLTRGRQLRDPAKVKSWLCTTLYRIFLGWKRQESRFMHVELYSAQDELPPLTPDISDQADSQMVMEESLKIDEHYRTPLALHYLQGFSYREIAEVLGVAIGTVMSRLSRGKDLLRQRLSVRLANGSEHETALLHQSRRDRLE